MARWNIYKCEKCGYEVQTEPSGRYMLMSGAYQDYLCSKCKEVVSIKIDKSIKNNPKCPECNSDSIIKWNPIEGKCPKCKGKMVLVPDTMIMAD